MKWVFAADLETKVWSVHPFVGEINLTAALKRAWSGHRHSVLAPPSILLLASEGSHALHPAPDELDLIRSLGVTTIDRLGTRSIPKASSSAFISAMCDHIQECGGHIHWSDLSRWALEHQEKKVTAALELADPDMELHRRRYMQDRINRAPCWDGPVVAKTNTESPIQPRDSLVIGEPDLDDLIADGLRSNNERAVALVAALDRVLAFRPRYANRWTISDELRVKAQVFSRAFECGDQTISEADGCYLEDCVRTLVAARRCDTRLGNGFSVSLWAQDGLLDSIRSALTVYAKSPIAATRLQRLAAMSTSVPRPERLHFLVEAMRESVDVPLNRIGSLASRLLQQSDVDSASKAEQVLEVVGNVIESAVSPDQWHPFQGGLTTGQLMRLGGKVQTLIEDVALSNTCRIKLYENGPRYLLKWGLTGVIPASHSSWSSGTAAFDSIQTARCAVDDLRELVSDRKMAPSERTLIPLVDLCKTLSLGRYPANKTLHNMRLDSDSMGSDSLPVFMINGA